MQPIKRIGMNVFLPLSSPPFQIGENITCHYTSGTNNHYSMVMGVSFI